MSDYPALARLRIGCVKYLNARPLIDRYPGPVDFAHPSELATGMLEDRLDAALVPVFEGLRHNDYLLVDGVAIAADGPVYSVFLAYRGELSEIRTVSLDRTSSGVPLAMTLPRASTVMSLQRSMTNSMLCSMTTKVARSGR